MLSRFLPNSRSISRMGRVLRLGSSVPVHQKPYNPSRYEVPSTGLKISTGYAFLDVEPMPRARIMKLGYIILEEVKKVPEDTNLRLWYEEKAKWVMETVDETEDIKELEVKLGKEIFVESNFLGGLIIEEFIQNYHTEFLELQKMIDLKIWEAKVNFESDEAEQEFHFLNQSRLNNKYGVFARENKNEMAFLEKEANKRAIE